MLNQLRHAWAGAREDVAEQPTPRLRRARAAVLVGLVARELLGMLLLVPYSLRALACWRARRASIVTASYFVGGEAENHRQNVSVFLPRVPSDGRLAPVVVFVHGGVWSSGEAWQYAPLAAALADCGVVTAVATYSLYPTSLVDGMVREVDAAVCFVQANAERWGGDGGRVTLLGHSAGAHLAAAAVLLRAAREAKGGGASPDQPRLPPLHAFVGLSGVYHVAIHYAHEKARGVHYLSTMCASMGGKARFDALSPLCTLRGDPSLAPRLPPVVLLGSGADVTVPHVQTELFAAALRDAGAPSLVSARYATVSHADFAISWAPRRREGEAPLLEGAALAARDGVPHGDKIRAAAPLLRFRPHVADVMAVVRGPRGGARARVVARGGAVPRGAGAAAQRTRCL